MPGPSGGGGCSQFEAGMASEWAIWMPIPVLGGEWGQGTQASFSRTKWLCCLFTQKLSVYLLGNLVPGWGTGHRQRWPPGQYSLPASPHTQPLSAGPSPSQLLQFCLTLLPPALPTSDALEILLQIQRCYCIPSFQNILS